MPVANELELSKRRMKLLPVDFSELQAAFHDGCWERRYYLDVATGDVVLVTEVTRHSLQAIYDEVGEEGAFVLLTTDELRQAHQVELDDERYLKIPERNSAEILAWCDHFAQIVEPPLQRLLWRSLDNADLIGFEQMLTFDPPTKQQWQQFKQNQIRAQLTNWLNQHEIDPIF